MEETPMELEEQADALEAQAKQLRARAKEMRARRMISPESREIRVWMQDASIKTPPIRITIERCPK